MSEPITARLTPEIIEGLNKISTEHRWTTSSTIKYMVELGIEAFNKPTKKIKKQSFGSIPIMTQTKQEIKPFRGLIPMQKIEL